jgi:putative DNA primase/helicase
MLSSNTYQSDDRLEILRKNLAKEFAGSGITPSIGYLNGEVLSGDDTYQLLTPDAPRFSLHLNSGAPSSWALRTYGHFLHGSIGYFGEDYITGYKSDFLFQAKLLEPKDPHRKYETKAGEAARLFFPRVSSELWLKIAEHWGISAPENIRIADDGGALGFWQWVGEHNEIPIALDEGVKKAIAVTESLIPCIGAGGHSMFYRAIDEDGNGKTTKHVAHQDLAFFLNPTREIKILLDRDKKPKLSRLVQLSRETIARLCIESKAVPFFVERDTEYKGSDDYIVALGKEKFAKLIDIATPIDPADLEKKAKKISSFAMAESMSNAFSGQLIMDDESNCWRFYAGGIFHRLTPREMGVTIQNYVMRLVSEPTYRYLAEVGKLLEHFCLEPKWQSVRSRRYIPFKNGVLDLDENQLLPHDLKYRFTSSISREYHPQGNSANSSTSDWQNIRQFLWQSANQRQEIYNLLIALCNVTLKSRHDLQKVYHLFGSGRNGKGTYIRLLNKLVGENSVTETSLERLCGGRFDSINIMGKKLVTLSDQSQYNGSIDTLKKATGGDSIVGEQKGKDAINFRFDGTIVIASNKQVFIGDNSYGVQSRLVTIPFDYTPPESDRTDIAALFDFEIDSFTSYLLSLPDSWVEDTIRGAKDLPSIAAIEWDLRMDGDSIAAFYHERLVPDDGNIMRRSVLYEDYRHWCGTNGRTAKSSHTFTRDLKTIGDAMGVKIAKVDRNYGVAVVGVRLREENDTPTTNPPSDEGGDNGGNGGNSGGVSPIATPSNPLPESKGGGGGGVFARRNTRSPIANNSGTHNAVGDGGGDSRRTATPANPYPETIGGVAIDPELDDRIEALARYVPDEDDLPLDSVAERSRSRSVRFAESSARDKPVDFGFAQPPATLHDRENTSSVYPFYGDFEEKDTPSEYPFELFDDD